MMMSLPTLRIRKDESSLSLDERRAFVEAMFRMKRVGRYDVYVQTFDYMSRQNPRPPAHMTAHHSGLFLPWHRWFLLQFEQELGAAIPYWDWTSLPDVITTWQPDFMGGDGDFMNNDFVFTGPFVLANGWMPQIQRALAGRRGQGPSKLPTSDQVNNALALTSYEGFRQAVEDMYNDVRAWIGGTITTSYAPEDPVTWLILANVDRLWAEWQRLHPQVDQFPFEDARNEMMDFGAQLIHTTPAHVLNHFALGYMYDEEMSLFTPLPSPRATSSNVNYAHIFDAQFQQQQQQQQQRPQSPISSPFQLPSLASPTTSPQQQASSFFAFNPIPPSQQAQVPLFSYSPRPGLFFAPPPQVPQPFYSPFFDPHLPQAQPQQLTAFPFMQQQQQQQQQQQPQAQAQVLGGVPPYFFPPIVSLPPPVKESPLASPTSPTAPATAQFNPAIEASRE